MATTGSATAERRSPIVLDFSGAGGSGLTAAADSTAPDPPSTTSSGGGTHRFELEKRIFNTGPKAGRTMPMPAIARQSVDDVDSSVVCAPSISSSRLAPMNSSAVTSGYALDNVLQLQSPLLLASELSNLSSMGSVSNLELPGTPEKTPTIYSLVTNAPTMSTASPSTTTIAAAPITTGRNSTTGRSTTGEKPKRAPKRKADGQKTDVGTGGGHPTPPSKAQRNITDFIKSPKRHNANSAYHSTVNGDSSSNDNQQFAPVSVSPQPGQQQRVTPNHLVSYVSSDSNQSPPNGSGRMGGGGRMDTDTQTDVDDECNWDYARDEQIAKRDLLIEEMRRKNDELQLHLANERRRVEASKETIKRLLVEQSTLERKQAKEKCMAECLRIGNFKPMRQGEHFKDVWADGYAFEAIQKQQVKINTERNEIIIASQGLRKRKPTSSRDVRRAAIAQLSCPSPSSSAGVSSTSMVNQSLDSPTGSAPMLSIGGGIGAVGSTVTGNGLIMPILSSSLSISQSQPSTSAGLSSSSSDDQFAKPDPPRDLSLQEWFEQDEIYRLRKEHLKKEEAELISERDRLERERNLHIRELKRVQYEESSRYKDHELLNKRYLLLSLLGKGGFSEVWRAFDLEENRLVACKIHHVNKEWKEDKKANYVKHAMREKDIHKTLDHPRIVKLFDLFTIDNHSFCTVLEYCDGNDLDFYLKQNKQIPEKEAKSIIMQIVSALKYLSEKRPPIIHYDLKPANILLQSGTTSGAIKITDFGLSKVMEDSDDADSIELTSQGAGTYWYLPPETFVVGHQPPKISSKVDVWSVGVILYQCLYGKRPFGHEQTQQKILEERTILNAKEVTFPNKPPVSTTTQDFIKKCLQYKKEERADVHELSRHDMLLFKPRGKASQTPSSPSPSSKSAKLETNEPDF